MDSTRDEENEYSSIDYGRLAVDRESTNWTSRSQLRSFEGNTYEEPSGAVKKREQKMFEPGETLPFVKNIAKKHQKSHESTLCSIKCGLLVLFILLTSALSLLFCLHYLDVMKLPDRGLQTPEVGEEIIKLKSNVSSLLKKTNDDAETIAEQKKVIDCHVADIGEARNNASDLSHEIKRLRDEIAEKDGRHATDTTKLKDNSAALQRTIDDQKKKMELQAADINKLTNNASILMDTISNQQKTISEKEEAIQRHLAELKQVKINVSELSQTIEEQKKQIDRQAADLRKLENNSSKLLEINEQQTRTIVRQSTDINRLENKINELAPAHTSVMLLGGWHDDVTNSTAIYDSMEKSWKNCKLTLPSTLGGHGAAIINNEIYIFGGYGNGTPNSSYKLGAGNKWERMADMNEKRRSISQSSVVFNSEIWVIGGFDTKALKSVEKYNTKTNKWTEMPELNEPRSNAAATVVDEKIYVSGGWDGSKSTNSVEVYDPEKGKWEIFTPSLPYAVDSHTLIGNHSDLIAIGGDLSSYKPTNRVWKIDVLNPKIEWITFLRQRRYRSGAAIIADGLMVFGGEINNINRIDSVEIFDGVKWKNGAPLPEKRGEFAYIRLTCAQERLFLKRYCQNS